VFERNVSGMQRLWSKLRDAVSLAASNNASVVVVSAEAFETSLCLRDPIFKKMITDFSKVYDVEMVYYKPDPIKHALNSWLQWGWLERMQYSDWVRSYFNRTTRKEFFQKKPGRMQYFCNLVDTAGWESYWLLDGRFRFQIIVDELDVVTHFLTSINLSDFRETELYNDLSPSERNVGWPKSLITVFPLFFDYFRQDYAKFDVIRQLLYDKEGLYSGDTLAYKEVLRLTAVIFGEFFSREAAVTSGFSDKVYAAIEALRFLFEQVEMQVLKRLISHLSDTIYFLNLKQRSSLEEIDDPECRHDLDLSFCVM
jgi:hypothetical protein